MQSGRCRYAVRVGSDIQLVRFLPPPPPVPCCRPRPHLVESLYSALPFTCIQCGMRFARRDALAPHLDAHFVLNKSRRARTTMSRKWWAPAQACRSEGRRTRACLCAENELLTITAVCRD